MKDRFQPQMIQSGLYAPNTFGRCDFFLQLWAILQQWLLPEVTSIQTFEVFSWVGVSWTPPYGIKTESISEPKVRSRNKSFLVKRNRKMPCSAGIGMNHNQLQFLRAESESIPVSWNQAQVW